MLLMGHAAITKKGAARLTDGHVWIYRSDIDKTPGNEPGIVSLGDERGRNLGLALYSPNSQITLRYLGAELAADFVRQRLEAALARRARLMPTADAYRWVHGEADLLPSVFIDRYGDCVAVQTLS